MKNIHVLPTDKPSRLHLGNSSLVLCDFVFSTTTLNSQHIYITSNEEIKKGDWCFDINENIVVQRLRTSSDSYWNKNCKKIILTTDGDLIKDGVQAIDDEFLEWFVKNPSYEEVEIENWLDDNGKVLYSRRIPKEESKPWYNEDEIDERMNIIGQNGNEGEHYEKTELDEVGAIAAGLCEHLDAKEQAMFIAGFQECIKWQAKRMYSEEEVIKIVEKSRETGLTAQYLLLALNNLKK